MHQELPVGKSAIVYNGAWEPELLFVLQTSTVPFIDSVHVPYITSINQTTAV